MSSKNKTWLRKEAKKVLYLLSKSNRKLADFRIGGGFKKSYEIQDRQSYKILMRLKKKGLVAQEKYQLHENNKYSCQAFYYLTNEGKRIAEGIAKEVDEYKSW